MSDDNKLGPKIPKVQHPVMRYDKDGNARMPSDPSTKKRKRKPWWKRLFGRSED